MNTAAVAAPEAPPALRISRLFPATPDRVFDAFTKPEILGRWWGPEGFTLPEVEVDPREGGGYRFAMLSSEGNTYNLSGRYLEIRRPERLVFTWAWDEGDMAGVETRVTLEFTAHDDATVLTLTHEGLPTEAQRDGHNQGWTSSFVRLGDTFDGGDGS